MIEVPIRENGGQPKWISLSEFKKILRSTKSNSPCPPSIKDVKGFGEWYNLYNKKTTRKQALAYWKEHIIKELIHKIMKHTKLYIEVREKSYRKDPIRYLRDRVWEDEIIKAEKKIDLDELYPYDTSGFSRKGRCSACGGVVLGNKFTIHKDDSDCCKAKINQYR